MVDGTVRRLPSWMTAQPSKTATANPTKETNKRKKQTHTSISTHFKQTTSSHNSFSLNKCRTTTTTLQTDHAKNGYSTKRSDDDDDFTVEDLVSIAEEYVKNEEGGVEKGLLKTDVRSKKKISEIGSCMCGGEGVVVGGDNEQVESSEQCRVQVKRSGDPARDMLDLFLGPLLNKPVEQDKKIDRLTNDMDFSFQLIKENRRDFQEDMVVPSKKKSSLKNKVSMLLD